MRRIYESRALRRDDTDPFAPRERGRKARPQAAKSIPSSWLSRKLVPTWLADRLVSVEIDLPVDEVPCGSSVPFSFVVRNTAPFPVTLSTRSLVFWEWEVDGYVEASQVPVTFDSDEPGRLTLDRGQRLRIDRRWDGMFKVSDSSWEWATPGEHTLRARLNVDDAAERGLEAETTVRLSP